MVVWWWLCRRGLITGSIVAVAVVVGCKLEVVGRRGSRVVDRCGVSQTRLNSTLGMWQVGDSGEWLCDPCLSLRCDVVLLPLLLLLLVSCPATAAVGLLQELQLRVGGRGGGLGANRTDLTRGAKGPTSHSAQSLAACCVPAFPRYAYAAALSQLSGTR